MKTFPRSVQRLSLLAGGLLICLPAAIAGPGGGAFGTGTGTATASSGGHAGASASTGAHASGSTVGMSRSAGSLGGGFHSTVGMGGGVRPGFNAGTGYARSTGSIYPAANFAAGQRIGNAQLGAGRGLSPLPVVNNAWTDPANPRVNVRPGNHLYPGAAGYTPDHLTNSTDNSRGHHRRYYNNFPYPVYFPTYFGNEGYGGYGNLGYYGGTADYAGLTADNSVADLGAPDFSTTPNGYYSYDRPAPQAPAPAADQPAPTQPLPDAPVVGPQSPTSENKSNTGTSQGPDSLVEAVQAELSRRGYYDGQPDAIYSDATKQAIRRFQTDQKLPATGRINEATLHALKLD